MDEVVEVDIVANIKADMHRARIGGAHVFARFGEAVAAALGLIGVAVLQQFDHHVVELDEAHVEPLRPAGEIGNGDRSRVDLRSFAMISSSVSSV